LEFIAFFEVSQLPTVRKRAGIVRLAEKDGQWFCDCVNYVKEHVVEIIGAQYIMEDFTCN
jgi:hypothetical protein